MTRSSVQREQRGRKIIDEKREKYRVKNRSLQNPLTDSKETTFVILINHTSNVPSKLSVRGCAVAWTPLHSLQHKERREILNTKE